MKEHMKPMLEFWICGLYDSDVLSVLLIQHQTTNSTATRYVSKFKARIHVVAFCSELVAEIEA